MASPWGQAFTSALVAVAVAGIARSAIAGNGRDHAGFHRHLANAIIFGVRDIEIARCVHCKPEGCSTPRRCRTLSPL